MLLRRKARERERDRLAVSWGIEVKIVFFKRGQTTADLKSIWTIAEKKELKRFTRWQKRMVRRAGMRQEQKGSR